MFCVEPQQGADPRFALTADHHILFQDASCMGDARVGLQTVDPSRRDDAPFGRQHSEFSVEARKELFDQVFYTVKGTKNGDHGRGNGGDYKHRNAGHQVNQALGFSRPEVPACDAKRNVHQGQIRLQRRGESTFAAYLGFISNRPDRHPFGRGLWLFGGLVHERHVHLRSRAHS